MAIEGFDYNEFSNMLAEQAKELVPKEMEKFRKDYIVKTLLNFSVLAGEAIANDTVANFNADQAILLTQIIAEWSFHKSTDLAKSDVPPEYWDGIMEKIAFTIYEIGKQSIGQNLPQDQILTLIEHHVKETYQNALQDLTEKGIINEMVQKKAESQSNLDEMMKEMDEQQTQEAVQNAASPASAYANVDPHGLKLASVALLLKTLSQDKVHSILNKFAPQDAQQVIQYMQIPDLEQKVDSNFALKCLKEIKTTLPQSQLQNPQNVILRIKRALSKKTPEQIELMLQKERIEVKRFVTSVMGGEFYDLPPKIANIVAQHVECSV